MKSKLLWTSLIVIFLGFSLAGETLANKDKANNNTYIPAGLNGTPYTPAT